MSDKTTDFTADQIRAARDAERNRRMFLRILIYVAAMVGELVLDRSGLLLVITILLIGGVEYTIWSVANGARHKRNDVKVRLMAIKRRYDNQLWDTDGSSLDALQTEYIYDKNGVAMTEGDLNRLAIQVRDAMRNGKKGTRRVHELTKNLTGIGKREVIELAKQLDYNAIMGEAEDILSEKINAEHALKLSRPNLRNVQYAEAIGTAHPELVAEAARLGMTSGIKNVRVGNSYIDIAAFNHEGADVFGADNEGTLYLSHGLRWVKASTDEINEVLDDLKKVTVS